MASALGGMLKIITGILDKIGGLALTLMMLLTVADVLLRAAGRPLVGTYEVVALSLALVIGFTIPRFLSIGAISAWIWSSKRYSRRTRNLLNTFTRLICIGLFLIISYNLFAVANELRASGEVSPTIQLPAYPLAYGVAVCCFIECFVFVLDIFNIWAGHYE